jgi:hypothetical protein
MIWQSPDMQVNFGNRGRATWHGDKLLCVEGQNGGVMAGYNWETKKYKYSQNYDRLQIWAPFSNKIIVALKLPGDVAYADWVDSLPALPAALIALTADSMILSYPDTSLKYWAISNTKIKSARLSLPLNYTDSLGQISAWVQTGYSGVWQVSEKRAPNLLPDVLIKSGLTRLPHPYTWQIYNMHNEPVKPGQVLAGSSYIFEAKLHGVAVYREKHLVNAN